MRDAAPSVLAESDRSGGSVAGEPLVAFEARDGIGGPHTQSRDPRHQGLLRRFPQRWRDPREQALEPINVIASPAVTHIKYRVVR
jgi:hypothetical protein